MDKITCEKCGTVTEFDQLDMETEKTAGEYHNSYYCPHCHEYIGFDVQDGTRDYQVIASSFVDVD